MRTNTDFNKNLQLTVREAFGPGFQNVGATTAVINVTLQASKNR